MLMNSDPANIHIHGSCAKTHCLSTSSRVRRFALFTSTVSGGALNSTNSLYCVLERNKNLSLFTQKSENNFRK